MGCKNYRGGGGLLILLIEIVFLIAIIMGLIMLVQGTRKVPVIMPSKLLVTASLVEQVIFFL